MSAHTHIEYIHTHTQYIHTHTVMHAHNAYTCKQVQTLILKKIHCKLELFWSE